MLGRKAKADKYSPWKAKRGYFTYSPNPNLQIKGIN